MRFLYRICDLYADRIIVLRIFGRKHCICRTRARVAYRLLRIPPFPADWERNVCKRLSVCCRQARRDLVDGRRLLHRKCDFRAHGVIVLRVSGCKHCKRRSRARVAYRLLRILPCPVDWERNICKRLSVCRRQARRNFVDGCRFFYRKCDFHSHGVIVLRVSGRKHRKRRTRARVAYRLRCILPFPADWECNIRKRLSICRRQPRRDLVGRRRFLHSKRDFRADGVIVLRVGGRKHRICRARARVAYRLLCILPFPVDWERNVRKRLSVCRRQARRNFVDGRTFFNDDLRCLSVRIIRLCDRTALLCLAKRRRPNIPCSHTFRKAVLVHAVRVVTVGKEIISVLQKPRNKEIRSRFDRFPVIGASLTSLN